MTRHAEQILALPAARHPKLAGFAQQIAHDARFTAAEATELLDAAAQSAGVSPLDIEMAQPGNGVDVKFAPMSNASPQDERRDGIEGHVRQLLGVAR